MCLITKESKQGVPILLYILLINSIECIGLQLFLSYTHTWVSGAEARLGNIVNFESQIGTIQTQYTNICHIEILQFIDSCK